MSNDHPPSAPPIPPYGTAGDPPSGSGRPPSGPSGSTASGGPVPPSWGGDRPAGRQYKYAADDFFGWIRGFGVTRADDGRWAAGVAAGISRRWDIDPVLVRGVFVATTLFGGIGIVAYGLGWLLLPQQGDGRIHLQRALHGDISLGFIGAVLLTLAGLGGGGWGHTWWGWGFPGGPILTVLVVAGIYWFAKRRQHFPGPESGSPMPPAPAATEFRPDTEFSPDQPRSYGPPEYGAAYPGGPGYPPLERSGKPAKPRKRDLSRPSKRIVLPTLGVALLAAAAILLAGHHRDWSTPAGLTAAATALLVISIGVLASGFTGRRAAGLTGIGLILAVCTVAGVGAHHSGVRSGQNVSIAGDQEWRPATAAEAAKEFNLGFGQETLWLSDPGVSATATPENPVRTQARLAAGHLIVVLPDDIPAEIKVDLGSGQITNPDGHTVKVTGNNKNHGETVRTGSDPAAAPLIVLEVHQGFGQLDLRTASQQGGPTAPAATPAPSVTITPSPAAQAPAAK
jgi:phage shock protein PspC (stress-responsive transcriptional regulator)